MSSRHLARRFRKRGFQGFLKGAREADMGEGKFFSAEHRGQPVPGKNRHRVYSNHPEPALTAWHAADDTFADAPMRPQAPHYDPTQYDPSPEPMGAQRPRGPARPRPAAGPEAAAIPAMRAAQTRTVLHGLGAVLSLALILGTLGWVWQLMQRDVAGVPVVRALEGPSRIAPENPGGRQAAHQGLSVNQLAAATEEMPPESIVLAPPPLQLQQDDMIPARMPETTRAPEAEFEFDAEFEVELEPQPIPVALSQELPDVNLAAEPLGLNNPTRRAVAASLRPQARDMERAERARLAARAPAPSMTMTDAGGLDDALAASLAASVASGLGGVRSVDVDPSSIGPGTRLVQLGAYDDEAAARTAWDQLAQRFAPLLDDRGRVIEAAHSGGSVFFRLRAHGFADERDARRFCSALVDQQIDCIPVLIR
ncbi:MAG: SPOR domain-containing protein [Rhodobacteraceae bacterium]|nr:MAG: SPOR domain-containing protein [Paracoccaceae bacterium]